MADQRQRIPLPNYTAFPNVLLDELLPVISPAEWKVLSFLARATFGYHRQWTDSRYTSLNQIAAKTGLHRNGVIGALKALHSTWGAVAWRVDPQTGAKSYSLRLEDEVADQTPAPGTVSVPPLVQSVDQPSTVSVPGGVQSVDPSKETINKEINKEIGGSTGSTAAPPAGRVCPVCSGPMTGLDLRYRYCSPACRLGAEQVRAAAAEGAAAKDPRVGEVMRLYLEVLGYVPAPYPANVAAAKRMLGDGYEPGAIMAAYKAAKLDPFWAARPLSLMSLAKQIGHLVAAGKVAGWSLEGGKAVAVAPSEQRRARRETNGQNAYARERLAALGRG